MNTAPEGGAATLPGPKTSAITYRTAKLDDIPAMTATLDRAGLPARLIEPYIDTFIVGESGGVIVACGGIEVHDDTAVLRSVAVDEGLRGSSVGHNISDLLIDLAVSRQVVDIYLFTGDVWTFWQKQGFVTISLEDWREPARACWQFEYVDANREWAESFGLRTMWMPAPR
jgi:amino-acid N-acetyltransferase